MITTGKVVALIQAMGGGADPAVIEAKVEEWLDAHPEATTTVQDGSITEQKLATSIAQKLGLITQLSDEIDSIDDRVTVLENGSTDGASPIINSASGAVASFADGSASPARSVMATLEPVQAGSGDPSPDNVRPITGRTAVQIVVSPTTDATDGQTYSITLPSEAGTVYGGTLDVSTGELVVDRAIVDLGTLNWDLNNVSQGKLFRSVDLQNASFVYNETNHLICSSYPVVLAQSRANKTLSVGVNGKRVDIIDNDYSDASAFRTAMGGVQLCYKLATPTTYTLTPTEIRTLLGENHIWSDAGDVSVKYKADTKLYIDGKIAELVARIVNS